MVTDTWNAKVNQEVCSTIGMIEEVNVDWKQS